MSGNESSSGATMVDAQFTVARVLRPRVGFERLYQGVSAVVPIAFPGVPDPRAGQPGFSKNLLAGIPMPLGARVKIFLPICTTPNPDAPTFNPEHPDVDGEPYALETAYRYRLVWRMRTVRDFRDPAPGLPRPPWHSSPQGPGAPEGGEARVPLPAAFGISAFEEVEPATGNGEVRLRVEDIVPTDIFEPHGVLDNLIPPLMPDVPFGVGIVQQGILDPLEAGIASLAPGFVVFDTEAQADELLIFANRKDPTAGDGNWDFTNQDLDLPFGNVFGTANGEHPVYRNNGILIMTGSAP